ncbi:BlaI/MecI/CopY family transcriptional regulator [Paraprevotella xylaniphila]|uniref:BlaI/MecI/CopY family transcriptional regulator n=1 Tax=Paraprevotella xylaniphila TaxID=454155 RepID=UPI0023F3F923|nr:BlaI/MecI/CopY family transcriptional regulator [Paraprevotella xylaniphila]
MKTHKQLTKSEFQVMDILWSLPNQSGFTSDILREYPEPKPAYTTLATFLKILKEKEFVRSENIGKMLRFTPTISRDEYTGSFMKEVKNTFFGGSFMSLISFFAEKENLNKEEINQLITIIKKGKQ